MSTPIIFKPELNPDWDMLLKFKAILKKKYIPDAELFWYYITYRNNMPVYNVTHLKKEIAELSHNYFHQMFEEYTIESNKEMDDIFDEIFEENKNSNNRV